MKAFLLILFLSMSLCSQSEAMIYGKVYLNNGDDLTGFIRWGDEEVLWVNLFNASKVENEYLDILDDLNIKKKRRKKRFFNFNFNFGSHNSDFSNHQFVLCFGDIKEIERDGRHHAIVKLKNGKNYEVKDSSNDLGEYIRVIDKRGDSEKIKWRKIDKIVFMNSPSSSQDVFGKAIYGKLESGIGDFEGFISWDNEESLDIDELDGEDEDGDDMSIPFSRIESIERVNKKSCRVRLKNGKSYKLRGTNDVNYKNRGILVYQKNSGAIKVDWEDFEKLNIIDAKRKNIRSYADFKAGKSLNGVVRSEEGDFTGKIIFDVDESLSIEFLDGRLDDNEYQIHFGNIKKIQKKSRYSVLVTLKNGDKLTLSDTQDVDKRNDGILVLKDEKANYIPWADLIEIEFK